MLYTIAPLTNVYAASDIDITTSSVREDLASMGEDKLSYVSDQYCIFIAMSQYYDPEGNLRSYVYFNFPTWANGYIDDLSINISTSVSDENYNITENYSEYRLRYINNESTWYKYEILGLTNLEETTRRYHIQEIFVNDGSGVSLDFLVDEVYIFNGITNDSIQVFNEEIETITITDKEVVSYCYGDGENIFFQETTLMNPKDIYTDAWYIFFNTDKKIDTLMEVELTYTQYDYHLYHSVYGVTKDSAVTEAVIADMKDGADFTSGKSYVNYHDPTVSIIEPGKTKVSYTDNKWFGKYDTYYEELDNIMDLKDYQAQDSDNFIFTDYAEKYTWGVHFKDTERQFEDWVTDMPIGINLDGSGMSDVAILRLKFKTSGIVHNCYAVDTPTDDFTGESAEVDTKFEEWFEKIFSLIGILVFVVIIGYLLPVFKALFEGVGVILKWILVIISLPFRLIGSLFRTKK